MSNSLRGILKLNKAIISEICLVASGLDDVNIMKSKITENIWILGAGIGEICTPEDNKKPFKKVKGE